MLWRIVLPLSMPGIVAVGVVAFFFSWNEYLFTSTLITETSAIPASVGIATLISQLDSPVQQLLAAGILFAILPVLFYVIGAAADRRGADGGRGEGMSADPLAAFRLDGKVALVTGGNGGLGQAIALGLRAAGAEVVVTGRDAAKNREAVEDHGAGNVLEVDVRDEDSVAAGIAAVVERHGRLDVLVNNAGVGGSYSVLEMTLDEWRLLVDTSLTGSFLCAKHGARAMIEAGNGGAIINLGSMYSVFGPPRAVGYASAKAGILGLSRALAVELAPHGIRSNAILPGWIETAMTAQAPRRRDRLRGAPHDAGRALRPARRPRRRGALPGLRRLRRS